MIPSAEDICRQFRLRQPFRLFSGLPQDDRFPVSACDIRRDGVWCVYNSYAGYWFRLWISDRYCCLFGQTDSESITDDKQEVDGSSLRSAKWHRVRKTLAGRSAAHDDGLINFLLESSSPSREWKLHKAFSKKALKFAAEALRNEAALLGPSEAGLPIDASNREDLARAVRTISVAKNLDPIVRRVFMGMPLEEDDLRRLMGRLWDPDRAKRLALENGLSVRWKDPKTK